MKVLLVAAYYYPHMGGVENYTAHLAESLVAEGHDVTVLTSKLSKEDPYEERDEVGYRIVRLPSRHFVNQRYPLLQKGSETRRFEEEFAAGSFDGVVINTRYYPISLFAAAQARAYGVPCLVVDHSSSYLTMGQPAVDVVIKAYEHLVTAFLKRKVSNYYAVSQDGVTWLKTFGIQARGVLNNAVDADAFLACASSRDFRSELGLGGDCVVTFTGRLISEKGVWTCLQVAKCLDGEGFSFVMAGEGPEFDKLQSEAPSNFHLVGRLDAPDVAALLVQSDVFLFPSMYPEGFPSSLLEAAAVGCCLITTPIGGSRDLIPDERYGIVLQRSSSSEEICEVLRDVKRGLFASCGDCASARVREQFTWRSTADAVIAALTSVSQEGVQDY